MKTCLIKQPAGIGDILFCQGIVNYITRKGYKVIYPVNSNLLYLKDYIATNNVEFCSIEDDFEYKQYYNNSTNLDEGNFLFLNTDTSHNHLPNDGIMPSKYQMLGLDPKMWIEELKLIRNIERERWLYYDYLKLKDDEKYILLNTKYGTPPNYVEFPIPNIDTPNKLVHMSFIEGTTIMDWLLVMEKANGIVTVDTCIQYLLEKLDINYEFYYCYTRDGSRNHITKFGLNKIFTINWNYLVQYN